MIVRNYLPKDADAVREIHERYYKDEFTDSVLELPHYIHRFLIENSKGKIITAGGVRLMAEAVAITDKAFSPRERREALLLFLETSKWMTGRQGYEHLHAFVMDDGNWEAILNKYGFTPCKGKPLYLQVL